MVASVAALLSASGYAADIKSTVNACRQLQVDRLNGCNAGCTGAAQTRCLNGCSKTANDAFNSCLSATNLNQDAR